MVLVINEILLSKTKQNKKKTIQLHYSQRLMQSNRFTILNNKSEFRNSQLYTLTLFLLVKRTSTFPKLSRKANNISSHNKYIHTAFMLIDNYEDLDGKLHKFWWKIDSICDNPL